MRSCCSDAKMIPHPAAALVHEGAHSVIAHHQQHERKKFTGRNVNTNSSYTVGEQVIAALNASNTALTPFTVDPLGGLGPLASRFLCGTASDPPPPTLSFRRCAPQQACNNATSAASPSAALRHADKSWSHNSSRLPFGATCHSWLPSTWARQILGANINSAFSEFMCHCMHRPTQSTPAPAACAHPLALGAEPRTCARTSAHLHQQRRAGSRGHTA